MPADNRVQLRFNLRLAPAGVTPLVDVSRQCHEFRLSVEREGVTIPPNGKTGRGTTVAGAMTENVNIACTSPHAADSISATMWEVAHTDDALVDLEGTVDPGPPSADNPLYKFTATLLRAEVGGESGARRGQTFTLPITEDGITTTTTVPAWEATTVYAVGDYVELTAGEVLEATVAGTSGATEPTAPGVIGGTVVDGTVTWKLVSTT